MATNRKSISKLLRFEVFKRDGFKCVYCGSHPPDQILHVDHVNPVKDGGGNEIDNLVTACAPCNLGKSARKLSDIPMSMSDRAQEVAEREEQIAGYQEIMEAKRQRIEDELWRVADLIEPGSPEKGMSRDWTASIRRFNEKLGVHSTLECAEIARGQYPYGGKKTFLYFCGICWNRIRGEEANA